MGNFFTKQVLKNNKELVDIEVNFLLEQLTNNLIFDKDQIEIHNYDYSQNFLADLGRINKYISGISWA